MMVKNVSYFGELGYLNSSCLRKSIILMFGVSRGINSRFSEDVSIIHQQILICWYTLKSTV